MANELAVSSCDKMSRKLFDPKLLQAVIQSLQKGGRGFAAAKQGDMHDPHGMSRPLLREKDIIAKAGRAVAQHHCCTAGARNVQATKQPSAAAQAAMAREKSRYVMDMPEVYVPTAEEMVQIERKNWITMGERHVASL